MTIAEVVRDSPAGQIARLYLGWKIAPYEDEKEGFELGRTLSKQPSRSAAAPGDAAQPAAPHADDAVGKDSRSGSEKDVEKSRSLEPAEEAEPNLPAQPKSEAVDDMINVVEFVGSNDRDNPQNWPLARKCFAYFQICLLTFSIYSASAIITPAEPTFERIFGIDAEVSALVLSMYVLGYGIGPLLFSPLSEMPDVGRNVAYISSFFMFVIMTAIASGVSNFPGLVVMRFLQGFFGGPVLSTGAASAQDIFPFNKVPYAVATWASFAYAGPALGPVMSGFAITLSTWRWGLWETLILCGITFALLFFFLPETNAEYILGQRAKRLRAKTGDESIKTKAEVAAGGKKWGKLVAYHLTMPFKITFLDPSILFINVYTALVYGIYYSFFESFPLVYIGVYGFSIGIQALVFLCVLIGAVIGLAVYVALVWFIYEPYTLKFGIGSPEYRLVPGIFAAALAPSGMFIFGYASKPDINWPAPTVGIALYAAASFILVNCIFVYLPISYPRYAASVFASNGFFRSALACGAIHFSQPLFNNLGVGNGCAILGSIAALCAVLFYGLYLVGARLRARSRFAESYS